MMIINPSLGYIGGISISNFNHIKLVAKSRNIYFDLVIEDLWQLFLDQNTKCCLTGLPITLNYQLENNGTASLNRIDSKEGYIIENVQWVHKDISVMKGQLTNKKLIDYCNLIYRYKI